MQNLMHADAVGRTVLVVEDEPLLAMDIQAALEDAGFKVLGPAPSVAKAFELISRERPDVAVLDYLLNYERVTPAAQLLNELAVPFVMASATDHSVLAGNEVLADIPNLGKPTDMRQLVEMVRRLLADVRDAKAQTHDPS